MPTIRAARPAASACTGTGRSRSPGGFVTPGAAGRAVQRRGRDGRDRPGARLVSRRHPRRHDHDRARCSPRRRPTPPGADGLVFLPYLAGERSPIWDPDGARRARRPDAGPRPRPPRAGDRRGQPRSPSATSPTPMLAAGVRGHRDARLRRPGPERVLEPGQGRRDRASRSLVPAVLETAVLGSAILGAVGDRRVRRPPGGDPGDDPHRRQRSSRAPTLAATYDRLFEAYAALYPATAPVLRPLARRRRDDRGRGRRSTGASRCATCRSRSRPAAGDACRSSTASTSTIPAGEHRRPHRAERLRQVDAPARHRRPARAGPAARDARRGSDHRTGSADRARVPGAAPAAVALGRGQHHLPAGAGRLARRAPARRGSATLIELVGARPGVTGSRPRSCRAGRASGWRSPARSRSSPGSCCSTSRSARSMR